MDFTINKDKRIKRREHHVKAVIKMAEKVAADGREYFNYPVTRQQRIDMEGDLIVAVKQATDEQVYCVTNGRCADHVRFGIQPKN